MWGQCDWITEWPKWKNWFASRSWCVWNERPKVSDTDLLGFISRLLVSHRHIVLTAASWVRYYSGAIRLVHVLWRRAIYHRNEIRLEISVVMNQGIWNLNNNLMCNNCMKCTFVKHQRFKNIILAVGSKKHTTWLQCLLSPSFFLFCILTENIKPKPW